LKIEVFLTGGQNVFGHRVHEGDTEVTEFQIIDDQRSVCFVSSLCARCPRKCPL